jgi:hypothetical protein
MNYGHVIRDAWDLTTTTKKLTWFAFVPSFVAVLVFVVEIAWQYSLFSEEFGWAEHGATFGRIGHIWGALADKGLIGWSIFLIFFVIIVAFVFPAWVQSTLILSMRQKFTYPERKLSLRQKFIEGFHYFFRLFEYHAVLIPFQFMTILFYGITFYRYYHGDLFTGIFLPALIIYSILSMFINLFFAYTPFYVVCENHSFGESVKKSIGLVFLNFGTTLGLILLMFLVNIRVIVNVLVVIGVPLGILAAASYFASSSWFGIAVGLAVIVGIGVLALAAYLTAILEVFSVGFWERGFTVLRTEQDKLRMPPAEEVAAATVAPTEMPEDDIFTGPIG